MSDKVVSIKNLSFAEKCWCCTQKQICFLWAFFTIQVLTWRSLLSRNYGKPVLLMRSRFIWRTEQLHIEYTISYLTGFMTQRFWGKDTYTIETTVRCRTERRIWICQTNIGAKRTGTLGRQDTPSRHADPHPSARSVVLRVSAAHRALTALEWRAFSSLPLSRDYTTNGCNAAAPPTCETHCCWLRGFGVAGNAGAAARQHAVDRFTRKTHPIPQTPTTLESWQPKCRHTAGCQTTTVGLVLEWSARLHESMC